MAENSKWTACQKIAVLAVVILSTFLWNWQFVSHTSQTEILAMNDVASILAGYKEAPSLFLDGLRWWHGSWIEDGIHVFRPVSSYLLWSETWLGLTQGFLYVAFIGAVLSIAVCLLTTSLAWRFTQSKLAVFLIAVITPAGRFWNMGASQPGYWLAWYPVHHDLLMLGFLFGALLAFDYWLESSRSKFLVTTWICFIAGALCKEFVYIFPVMAAVLVLARRRQYNFSPKNAWLQIGLMCGCSVLLFGYRSVVLVNPYNPPRFKRVHFLRKPFLYWFPSYYKYVLSDVHWFAGLAVVIFALSQAVIYARKRFRDWFARPLTGVLVGIAVLVVISTYCQLTYSSAMAAIWFIFDAGTGRNRPVLTVHLSELLQMVFALYTLWIFWDSRKTYPTMAALSLVAIAYLPVFTYLGWHYTLAGWYARCGFYWPLVAVLIVQRNPEVFQLIQAARNTFFIRYSDDRSLF